MRSNAHWVRSNAFFYGLLNGSHRIPTQSLIRIAGVCESLLAASTAALSSAIFHPFSIHLFHSMKLVKADWVKESYLQPWSPKPKLNVRASD